MSAVFEHLHTLLAEAKAEIVKLLGHGDAEVQAAAHAADVKLDAVKTLVEADIPVIEHEVKADADELVRVGGDTVGAVAHEVETAAAPVVTDAEHDAETVATEAAADATKAL